MQTTVRRIALIALASVFVACHCAPKQTKSATLYIEKDAHGVLIVPTLGEMADHMQALIASARGAPGGATLIKASADIATRLGFDPLTREGQKQAGLDPDRSMAISGIARSDMLMVLPYKDLSVLSATVTNLLAKFGDQTVRNELKMQGYPVVTFTKPGALRPTFAYTTAGGNMLLASGADPVVLAIAAVERPPQMSLGSSKEYLESQGRMGQRDAYLYNLLPEIQTMFAIPPQTMLGLSVAAKEIALRVHTPLSPERQKKANEFFATGDTDLTALPSGQPIYMRGAIDWAKVLQAVEPTLATQVAKQGSGNPLDVARAFFKNADIDLDKELVGNLEPGFALTLGIAPTADVSNALQLDPRRVNPFQNYTLVGVGRVKDPKQAAATMEKFPKLMQGVGATVARKELAGGTVYTAAYSLGEGVSWALRGKQLIVAGGFGDKLGSVIEQVSKNPNGLDMQQFPPKTRDLLMGKQGVALAVDFGRIDEAVTNLKAGTGLQAAGAEMARSLVSSILHQIAALRPAVAVEPAGDGVNVDVAVSLK